MPPRARCPRCQRPSLRCYCAQLPSPALQNHWPVTILQHPQESRHALGTARIAQLGLGDCTLLVGDTETLQAEVAGQVAEKSIALIYPGTASQPLSVLREQPPQRLLFIDATWRKSRRLLLESAWFAAQPRYHLESPPPSRYRIRKEPHSDALSTLEAIVHALGFVEDDENKYTPLLRIMDSLIDEQIREMGLETFAKNYQ
ncbi:MAG: tRNA-uridine aminocarboxypropyltransferase [Gammaproteobacteria bacterium]|nr:tRNA-uridine aminocarboxypropyltransferase [Gammaproteobacteria bacterium]